MTRDNLFKETPVHIFDFEAYTLSIVYVEYIGGGECYEFNILKDGKTIYQSEDGWGNALNCTIGAFQRILALERA